MYQGQDGYSRDFTRYACGMEEKSHSMHHAFAEGVPLQQCHRATSLNNKMMLQVWEFAHGQDSRLVEAPQARKSIGAQVYYGVRLDGDADADKFLDDLAGHTIKQLSSPPAVLVVHL